LREDFPASAHVFTEMAGEESEHRRALLDLYREKFGEHIPLVRRQDVRGFLTRKPVWQLPKPSITDVRKLAESMEAETSRFYRLAASRSTDTSTRKLLGDLAEAEQQHEHRADQLSAKLSDKQIKTEDQTAERQFVLQYVQPGLVGLMDGFSRRRFPPGIRMRRSWWGWRPRSAPGFRWDLPRRFRMTAA
jgi:rubrerythrin